MILWKILPYYLRIQTPGLTVLQELSQKMLGLPFPSLEVSVVWETVSFQERIFLLCSYFHFDVTGKIFHFHLLNMDSRFHSRRPKHFYERYTQQEIAESNSSVKKVGEVLSTSFPPSRPPNPPQGISQSYLFIIFNVFCLTRKFLIPTFYHAYFRK